MTTCANYLGHICPCSGKRLRMAKIEILDTCWKRCYDGCKMGSPTWEENAHGRGIHKILGIHLLGQTRWIPPIMPK